jgi:2-oxoglutarate ferredoxin oxidoreductase subunit delta
MRVFARTPLDIDRVSTPRGKVYILPERCKECQMCIVFCPREVLEISHQKNNKGYHYPEIAPGKEVACVHCEFCSLVCPEFAIYTLPLDGMSP